MDTIKTIGENISHSFLDSGIYQVSNKYHISTRTHSIRVRNYAELLARELPDEKKLSEKNIEIIKMAALNHDNEKLNWPNWLFEKNPLSESDWRIIRVHPEKSREIFEDLFKKITSGYDNIRETAAEAIDYHHLRYDGHTCGERFGYNKETKGEEIAIGGRVLKIVDSFDAMTHRRTYRDTLFSPEKAKEEIEKSKGEEYCPVCVDAFLRIPLSKLEKICHSPIKYI